MNLLGDNRYTTAGEYAAFVDGQSAARRDRVYEANRAQLEAAYRAQDPKLTPDQVRAKWMAEHPLGWVEHRLAWGPSGELGKWATRNPAILKIGGTLFVHGGISAEYAKLPIDEINQRVAAAMAAGDDSPDLDPHRSARPALVSRTRPAATPTRRPRAPRPSRRRRPLTPDQELDAVLAGLWRAAARDRPHAEPAGHPDHRQRPPGAHRYRHFALLRRAAELARDHRRPDDPAHGAAVAMKARRGL